MIPNHLNFNIVYRILVVERSFLQLLLFGLVLIEIGHEFIFRDYCSYVAWCVVERNDPFMKKPNVFLRRVDKTSSNLLVQKLSGKLHCVDAHVH